MLVSSAPASDRIVEPMIALAGCSKNHRIVVAGAKASNSCWIFSVGDMRAQQPPPMWPSRRSI